MRAGLIAAVVFIWVIALILSIPMTGTNLFADPQAMAASHTPLSLVQVWTQSDWGALVTPTNWPGYFNDIYNLAVLNLPIFGDSNSPFQLVRWIFLSPIISAIVFTLIILGISLLSRSL